MVHTTNIHVVLRTHLPQAPNVVANIQSIINRRLPNKRFQVTYQDACISLHGTDELVTNTLHRTIVDIISDVLSQV